MVTRVYGDRKKNIKNEYEYNVKHIILCILWCWGLGDEFISYSYRWGAHAVREFVITWRGHFIIFPYKVWFMRINIRRKFTEENSYLTEFTTFYTTRHISLFPIGDANDDDKKENNNNILLLSSLLLSSRHVKCFSFFFTTTTPRVELI